MRRGVLLSWRKMKPPTAGVGVTLAMHVDNDNQPSVAEDAFLNIGTY